MSMGKLLASQNDTSSSFTCLASCHQLLGRLNRLYLGIEVSKLSDSSSSNSLTGSPERPAPFRAQSPAHSAASHIRFSGTSQNDSNSDLSEPITKGRRVTCMLIRSEGSQTVTTVT
eukprot:757339-Hanusia_phi.AAC.4